ncbi:MAG: DUF4123 domain-containing protein [candidate division Zixibacteria bacterium]|nr:DUF4123 domain-containing protein [candidate division Zixibacteria bacterium]
MFQVKSGFKPLKEDAVASDTADSQPEGQSLAEQLLQLAEEDSGQLFALLDAARTDTVLEKLAHAEVEYRSLYLGQAEEQYSGVSPFLVECKEDAELFNWLTTDTWGGACGIFLIADDTFINLFTHFRKFLMVKTEAGEKFLFRFYDPRVLRVYLPTCTAQELDHFYGQATRFLVESPAGGTILSYHKYDADAGKAKSDVGPTDVMGKMIIRDPQMASFTEASIKDFENRMVVHLNEFFPEQCEALGEPKTREAIRYGIKRAATYGIDTERNVCKYTDIMFAYGRDFDKNPELPWAAEVLNSSKYADQTTRIEELHRKSVWHAHQAANGTEEGRA